jgi:hypothetical protein
MFVYLLFKGEKQLDAKFMFRLEKAWFREDFTHANVSFVAFYLFSFFIVFRLQQKFDIDRGGGFLVKVIFLNKCCQEGSKAK